MKDDRSLTEQLQEPQSGRVVRRLAEYALQYKRMIAVALAILIASVGAQLAGPYIAKEIIDKHILAIQWVWYEVPAGDAAAASVGPAVRVVEWNGKRYVREDWLPDRAAPDGWRPAKIEQNEGGFALLSGDERAQLAPEDVVGFYRHDVFPVVRLLGWYIGFLFAAGILTFIQSYMLQTLAVRIIQKLRMDIMRHIHRLPVRYFDNTPVGQVVSRVANDTEAIKELFMSFMATFVVSGVNLLGIYAALFVLDWKLALLCVPILPLIAAIMWFHLKYSKGYISAMRARLSDMNAMLNESIKAMPMIQAFRRERTTLEEFEALNRDRYVNQIKQNRLFSLSSRNVVGLIGGLTSAGILWFFGGQSLEGAISFGVLYAFMDYTGRIFQPIIGIFDQLTNAQRAIVSAERVFALMDREPEENTIRATGPGAAVRAERSGSAERAGSEVFRPGSTERADPEPFRRGEAASADSLPKAVPDSRPLGHVRFEQVYFAYNGDEYVLKDINFEAKQGETVALVGHTGSGKSSVMNLLLGFYSPSRGRITIDGRDIAALSRQDLRRHMGIVLQDPFLFAGDIKFNVSLYNEEVGLERVRDALREVGAEAFVQSLPGGMNEPVVERGGTLSAGQRQLISFARALAYNPAILILDEATSSIDSETEGIIQQALKVLCRGRTTFVIAHRLSTIREADRILVLHRGEVVEAGTHEELMRLGGRYYTMYQLQKGSSAAS